jgi:nucleoside-diphosphate-sugar epimerase
MKTIFLTGHTGFVGRHFQKKFSTLFKFTLFDKKTIGSYDDFIFLHLAGKAHDLKNISSQEEYYKSNTELSKQVFDAFLASNAKVFITLSSVKAIADNVLGELSEEAKPNPITHYGKSKLLAEQYILSQSIPNGKRVYILRPCMIHGPGNKGNLNLLYNIISKGLPWPLGLFENSRSYLSIENLFFIIIELIDREDIPSGVYNVADDVPLSTNQVINLIAESKGKKAIILNINKNFVKLLAHIGDILKFPINTERMKKLTESYIVSNAKIKKALGKNLPVSSKNGLIHTFQSFYSND